MHIAANGETFALLYIMFISCISAQKHLSAYMMWWYLALWRCLFKLGDQMIWIGIDIEYDWNESVGDWVQNAGVAIRNFAQARIQHGPYAV